MGAYNCVQIDFVDGSSQFRFYDNPITYKDYMCGEKSKKESDLIDRKIKNRIFTPFGVGDVVEDIVILSENEKLAHRERSIANSVNRTKNMIYNYARGNKWEWFITFTFDSKKVNRYDYVECSKKLRKWLNNIKNKYAPDLKYLIIPERHKDGAFHFHGVLANTCDIKFNKAKNKHTAKLLFTKKGLQIFNFGSYKMGYSTATEVTDTSKVSSYITKYITKELAINIKGYQRYYSSTNLNLPCKSYYFLENKEKIEFLEEHKNSITFSKNVRIKNGHYENLVEYIELNLKKVG